MFSSVQVLLSTISIWGASRHIQIITKVHSVSGVIYTFMACTFIFTFPTVSFHLCNYVTFTYRQDIYLIEIRINCCPLSESCSWNDPMILPYSWSLIHFMCVHVNCEQIIQVFFTPLTTKDKKFTASLQSLIATCYHSKCSDFKTIFYNFQHFILVLLQSFSSLRKHRQNLILPSTISYLSINCINSSSF